jgi:tight adherence protein B
LNVENRAVAGRAVLPDKSSKNVSRNKRGSGKNSKANRGKPDFMKMIPRIHPPQKADIPADLLGVVIILVLSKIFYNNLAVAVILSPLLIPFHEKMLKERIMKENHEIGRQFRDAPISVVTSLKAGYSIENSFVSSYTDMARLYGEQSPICRELRRIEKGLRNNIQLETLLAEMGARTLNRQIVEFSGVFAVAKRNGGNMTAMLEDTTDQISVQTEVEKEIDVVISAGRTEARIMEVVPCVIIGYVGLTNPGFFDCLYGNFVGILIMTVCIIAYLASCIWIEKMIEIEV